MMARRVGIKWMLGGWPNLTFEVLFRVAARPT
jgi:hypothetical protein